MMDWVGFGEKISEVGVARSPGKAKLVLENTVAEPVVAKVDGSGAFEFDGVVREGN